MALSLENHRYQFSFFQENSTWSLIITESAAPRILNARLRVIYRKGSARFFPIESARWETARDPQTAAELPGRVEQIMLEAGPDANGVVCRLCFALPAEGALFFWRVELENRGDQPIQVERIELLRAGPFPDRSQAGEAPRWPSFRTVGSRGATPAFLARKKSSNAPDWDR